MTDISLIITLHNEDLIAIPTLKSALQSAKFAQKKGISVEIIASLDRPSQTTKTVIQNNKFIFSKVVTVDYGDLSQSRNHAIKIATGSYIAILDADDLISENWLFEAFQLAHHNIDVIIHPEANLYFGRDSYIYRHRPQHEMKTYLEMFDTNPWTALSFGKRSIFLKFPYEKNSINRGYGYEDWLWNCETLASNINHIIAPDTVHFIRQKRKNSLVLKSFFSNCIIKKSKLSNIQPLYRDERDIVLLTEEKINGIKARLLKLVKNKLDDVIEFDGLLSKLKLKFPMNISLGPPIIGIGEAFAKIMTLLRTSPDELVICDEIISSELKKHELKSTSTLLITESIIDETIYKKYNNLLVVQFSNKLPQNFLERFITDFIEQYKPKKIINNGSISGDMIYEKYSELLHNTCLIELNVMHRHLTNDRWPFIGYPHYASLLNQLTFEDQATCDIFNAFYHL